VWASQAQNGIEVWNEKEIYMYANKISIVGQDVPKLTPLDDDVRPQFHVANADELGTYQAQNGMMSLAPRQYGASISAVRSHPTHKWCGFSRSRDKRIDGEAEI
jgi:hypothetical protein